ncbi:Ricin-type beta-trefoil lectin domain-containing protein [Kibdelosporangium aridum]|uniref:Ricin-type beta-trefoil lectin domain-containing protein n=2 Tax=Kibdelosporangium aridum TaxID=2030 RepID=A0A1Y5X2Z2_KIBAR|nr:Ricin-type beta-trefoil lectin domain-containing protein [Kibdelosporangium aridum]
MFSGEVLRRRRTKIITFAMAVVSLVAAYLTVITVVAPREANAAIDPAQWYTVTSVNSGKCVDARAAGTANGTAVQQYACNSTGSQQWQFQPTSDGYYRVNSRNLSSQVWDVADVSSADGGLIHLWTYGGGNNQQWQAVEQAGGAYHFVSRHSGKCLDVPGASTADSQQLQQYTCNNTAAQSFTLTPVGSEPPPGGDIDLGPNTYVFDPSMPASTIQSRLNSVFSQQERAQFGQNRVALLFKPGTYNVNANIGFFTQIAGLGFTPDAVNINGSVHVEADWFGGNATQNFWRAAENLSVTPTGGTDRWAVSQAAPYRRMHVRGNLLLDDGGWSSGGWMSDTLIDGQVRSGSQQQWISRNTRWGSWTGSNWNMVFVGVENAPAGTYPNPPYTRVAQTPIVREKPFLYIDNAGKYQVFVPALRQNTSGITWQGTQQGQSLPIEQFFIVKPGATAQQINAELAAGKNLLFTPGVYRVNETIRVTRPDTVVLGLGLATLVPENGVTAMSVADVDGVKVAGIMFDANVTNSNLLMEVGPPGSNANHAANPTSLHDVFFRVGGPWVGKATTSLTINSNNVIGDHTWVWRADHAEQGVPTGWYQNTGRNGLIVNGNNVTFYGLFVEHYQQYNVIWNGQGGRTYFFQNELPYDPPSQGEYMNGSTRGWAAYKVADHVTSHEAWGLGAYCFFNVNRSVVAERAFEVPNNPNVRFHNIVGVSLGGGVGTINRLINNTAGPINTGNPVNVINYP